MKRHDLLLALKRVEPALGSGDLVAATSYLCFTGKTVMAYDDRIALVTPCDTLFTGGVPGRVLLDILGASTAEEVEFEELAESIKVKCGRTRLTLPRLSPKEFLFTPAETTGKAAVVGSKELLQLFRDSLLSVGVDPSAPSRLGVTISFRDSGSVHAYSSDDTALTHVTCPVETTGKFGKPEFILSMRFLQTLLNIASGDSWDAFFLCEDSYVLAGFASGTHLYARLLEGANTKQFEDVIDSTVTKAGKGYEVPSGLARTLDRACLLVGSVSTGLVTLELTKDQLVVTAEERAGSLVERHNIKGSAPAGPFRISPDRLRKALPRATTMTPGTVVILSGLEFLHLLATRGE